MNPYVKRSVKVKSLNDMTAKEKFSPLTSNLISEYQAFPPASECGPPGGVRASQASPSLHLR